MKKHRSRREHTHEHTYKAPSYNILEVSVPVRVCSVNASDFIPLILRELSLQNLPIGHLRIREKRVERGRIKRREYACHSLLVSHTNLLKRIGAVCVGGNYLILTFSFLPHTFSLSLFRSYSLTFSCHSISHFSLQPLNISPPSPALSPR